MSGPDYSTANGSCAKGDRMMVALMRMEAGSGAEPHSHRDEQWNLHTQGTFEAIVDGQRDLADPHALFDTQCEFRRRGRGIVLCASNSPRDTREETTAGVEVHLYGVRTGPKF